MGWLRDSTWQLPAVVVTVGALFWMIVIAVDEPRPPDPVEFAPLSVTFVAPEQGWALGVLDPCPAEEACAQVQQTEDGGRTWVVARSVTVPENASALRYANPTVGWMCSDRRELWTTRDGGVTWTETAAPGGERPCERLIIGADAVRLVATGPEGDLAVYDEPDSAGAWPVRATFAVDGENIVESRRRIVMDSHGDTAWIAVVDRRHAPGTPPREDAGTTATATGAMLVGDRLLPWRTPCTGPGEYPSAIAAASDTRVFVTCVTEAPGRAPGETVFTRHRQFVSDDGGAGFTAVHDAARARPPLIVATTPFETVGDLDGQLVHSGDGAWTWTDSSVYRPEGQSVLSYTAEPGFLTPVDGFVLRTTVSLSNGYYGSGRQHRALLATHDAGRTWSEVVFAGGEPGGGDR